VVVVVVVAVAAAAGVDSSKLIQFSLTLTEVQLCSYDLSNYVEQRTTVVEAGLLKQLFGRNFSVVLFSRGT
jgi:hypothetical protein